MVLVLTRNARKSGGGRGVVCSGRNLAGGSLEPKKETAPIRCVQGVRARLLLRGDEGVPCAHDGHVGGGWRRRWARVSVMAATEALGSEVGDDEERSGEVAASI